MNKWWIPNVDINKSVIIKEIQCYLGPEATARPFTKDASSQEHTPNIKDSHELTEAQGPGWIPHYHSRRVPYRCMPTCVLSVLVDSERLIRRTGAN